MLKLKKLYSLINRNATIKLVNEKHTDVYFCGTVKDIPDQYDLWKVVDLFELNSNCNKTTGFQESDFSQQGKWLLKKLK